MIGRFRALTARLVAAACRVLLMLAVGVTAWGVAVLGLRFPFIGMLVLGGLAWWRLHRQHVTDSYGSATTASLSDMESGGLLADGHDSLILGRFQGDAPSVRAGILGLFSPRISSDIACRTFFAAFFGGRWLSDRLIRVRSHVHLLTCSPAGGGKGVAALIPNLLSYRGNCVIVDPKGELYRETARHRKTRFGHRIIRLDPFNVCGPGGDSLNPFDFINAKSDDFLDQVRDLSDMLVIRQEDEKDPHWNESACSNITAFSAFVCGCEPDRGKRNLGTVRALVSSRAKYAMAVQVMQQADVCQGVISRLGGELTWHEAEELASVQSTVARHTNFLDSPAVFRNIAESSFDPMILRQEPADIFLILPHDRLASLSRLQRLWVGSIMRRVTSGVPTEKNPVLWLLDEMAHIGRMQAIEDATTLMRGMGMRLWFIFQSLDQLKTCFGAKAATVLDNIGTQQYFGINSYATAEEISKRVGDTTIGITTVNDTSGDSHATGNSPQPQGGNRSTSRSVNQSEIARRLIKPEEVLTLSPDLCLIFHKHLPVCVARLVKYYNAPEFRRRWGGGRDTAPPRRLGIAAAVLALFSLCASCVVAAVALGVVRPQSRPRWPGVEAGVWGSERPATALPPPSPSGHVRPAPHYRPTRWHGSRSHRPSRESGYLIKIE